MSTFSPLGSCQRQFLKTVEPLVPAANPKGFLNPLGFAMWMTTTRQQHNRAVTRYQTDLTDAAWRVIGLFVMNREISVCTTGRTRTSNQTVIAETRVNQGSPH